MPEAPVAGRLKSRRYLGLMRYFAPMGASTTSLKRSRKELSPTRELVRAMPVALYSFAISAWHPAQTLLPTKSFSGAACKQAAAMIRERIRTAVR